jgi:hypothetical protein
MDNNAEGCQRVRRTPLLPPLLGEDLEVLRTDVDGVGSLMEGDGVPSFPTRSGGPRGDTSVLLAQMVLPLLEEDLKF